MRISTILFGLLFFSAVVAGFGGFIVEMNTEYGLDMNDTGQQSQASYVGTYSDNMYAEMNDTEGGLGQYEISGIGDIIVTSFYTLAKSFIGGIDAMQNAVLGIGQYLNVPSWIFGIVLSGITLLVIFAIVNAIWKKEF